jgi:hypothetical protein
MMKMLKKWIAGLVLAISTLPAMAVLDTPAQRAAFAADVAADPVLSQMQPSSNAIYDIIAAYKAPTSYVIWRSQMTTEISRPAIVAGASQLDALTVGKRDSLLWLCAQTLDARNPNVRTAIADLTGTQTTLKNALEAALRRNANRLEKLFSTGTGTAVSPGTASVEGELTYGDVLQALNW